MSLDAAKGHEANAPLPGSEAEKQQFAVLQHRLAGLVERESLDADTARTVVIVPSLSFDLADLAIIRGVSYYEERLLSFLTLLQHPPTHLIYLTSQPVAPAIVQYYRDQLPNPATGRGSRLTLLSCSDASPQPLTRKLLDRPRLLRRIRAAIPDATSAYLLTFNSTPLERSLAVRLDLPLYGCDPDLIWLGTKSGSRQIFRAAQVAMPAGFEDVRNPHDVARALADLKTSGPTLRRAVVKQNEGFSGIGNALFAYDAAPSGRALTSWIEAELPRRLRFEAPNETWDHYSEKLARTGGIVEAFVEADGSDEIRSPSVQCHIDPLGTVRIISTHDQVMGGPSGQVFLGCSFPADNVYVQDIQAAGHRIAAVLRDRGVVGRFGVDFISVRRANGWEHCAVEINLRMGGTTHPYLTLQALTGGSYDTARGEHRTAAGDSRAYVASDNLHNPAYSGLTPDDLMDIIAENNLLFDHTAQQGVVFHLIGALSEHGKLGAVCVADSRAKAESLLRQAVAALDAAAAR
ncbi:MAG: peptide ligase PGM1-related protein [Chloroflexota bacterium]|nr:peptide ligase PGM1-related protein [Chloroflexota bacterium]